MSNLPKISGGFEWIQSSQWRSYDLKFINLHDQAQGSQGVSADGKNVNHASKQFQYHILNEPESIIMKIQDIHKAQRRERAYECVCEPRGIGNTFPLNYKFKL